MPRVKHVKKARKSIPESGIEVGDEYYWWKFRQGGKRVSKTYPTRQQLTQSGFKQSLYDIEDNIAAGDVFDKDQFDEFRDDIISQVESLRDDCQGSLDNMPYHLQESSILTDRVQELDSWISDLQNVECEDIEQEEDESGEEFAGREEEAARSALEEFKSISHNL